MSLYCHLGNSNAVEGYREPDSDNPEFLHHRPISGEHITEFVYPENIELEDAFVETVVAMNRHHLVEGGSVDWVESNSPELALLLAKRFKCPEGKPSAYGQATNAHLGITQGIVGMMVLQGAILTAGVLYLATRLALRTNAGRDFMIGVVSNTGSTGTGTFAPACWMAVSADTAAPLATDVTLPGEITSGTLARVQGTYSHTTGTASYTLIRTFTSDQTIVIAKAGAYNAASGGTLVFETLLNNVSSCVSGDQTQITLTVTL